MWCVGGVCECAYACTLLLIVLGASLEQLKNTLSIATCRNCMYIMLTCLYHFLCNMV